MPFTPEPTPGLIGISRPNRFIYVQFGLPIHRVTAKGCQVVELSEECSFVQCSITAPLPHGTGFQGAGCRVIGSDTNQNGGGTERGSGGTESLSLAETWANDLLRLRQLSTAAIQRTPSEQHCRHQYIIVPTPSLWRRLQLRKMHSSSVQPAGFGNSLTVPEAPLCAFTGSRYNSTPGALPSDQGYVSTWANSASTGTIQTKNGGYGVQGGFGVDLVATC